MEEKTVQLVVDSNTLRRRAVAKRLGVLYPDQILQAGNPATALRVVEWHQTRSSRFTLVVFVGYKRTDVLGPLANRLRPIKQVFLELSEAPTEQEIAAVLSEI